MPPKQNLRKRPPPPRSPSPPPHKVISEPSNTRASTPSSDTPYPDRILSSLNSLLDSPPPHLSEAELQALQNRRKLLLNRKAAKQTRQKAKTAQEEMVEAVKERARVVRGMRDKVALMTVRQGVMMEREREMREEGEARKRLEEARSMYGRHATGSSHSGCREGCRGKKGGCDEEEQGRGRRAWKTNRWGDGNTPSPKGREGKSKENEKQSSRRSGSLD